MVSGVKVWVIEPDIGEKIVLDTAESDNFNPGDQVLSYSNGTDGKLYTWDEWDESVEGIYTLSPNTEQFVFVSGINSAEVFFGNGIIGKQPVRNSVITVELYITQGEAGHVVPNAITRGDKIFFTVQPRMGDGETTTEVTGRRHNINYTVINPVHSQGGVNTPTLPEIKRNAIVNLRSKGKLVSELDYDDINTIMGPAFPTVEAYPILKRSDIKVNEIMAFILLQYHDEEYLPQIVPTRNAKMSFVDPTFNDDGNYTIMRTSQVTIDSELYETLYNITLDKDSRIAYYDYILQNVKGSPTIMYNDLSPSWYQQFAYIPITGVDFDVEIEDTDDSSSSSSSGIHDSNHIYPLKLRVNVNHIPQDQDSDFLIDDYRCKMITRWGTNEEYDQILGYPAHTSHDVAYQYFEFEIPNYLDVPPELQRFEFHIEAYAIRRNSKGNIIDDDGIEINPTEQEIEDDPNQFTDWQPLTKYYTDVVVRKDLSDVMLSTITVDTEWTGQEVGETYRYNVHNIPTILSMYLDAGDGENGIFNRSDNANYPNFEVTVMQTLINNLELDDKKMLTDFINIKFPDTYGPLNNLKFNPYEYTVRSRYKTPFNEENPDGITWNPEYWDTSSSSSLLPTTSKYIVNGVVDNYELAGRDLSSYINYVAEYYDGIGWYLIKPSRGMYVLVEDELDIFGDEKIIIYDGDNWIDIQSFRIPLKIDLKIEMDSNATMSGDELKRIIREELVDHFSPQMGIQKNLDRSEIVTVTRQIPGVKYCEIRKPEIDIRFNYDVKDLTQLQLIDYTPQYVGFVGGDRDFAPEVQDEGIQIEIVQ